MTTAEEKDRMEKLLAAFRQAVRSGTYKHKAKALIDDCKALWKKFGARESQIAMMSDKVFDKGFPQQGQLEMVEWFVRFLLAGSTEWY